LSVEILYAFGNPNIGVYICMSEKAALIPVDAPEKVERTIQDVLKVNVHRCTIYGSPLVGVLAVMNSNGVLLGRLAREEEVERIRRMLGESLNIGVLDVRENALGNLVLANDRGALISNRLPKEAASQVADVLDVDVERGTIAGSYLVGALGVATNRGALLTPLASAEDISLVKDVLKVARVDVGTVNKGNVFLKSGLVANSNGALVGYETTGPELMRISSVLF